MGYHAPSHPWVLGQCLTHKLLKGWDTQRRPDVLKFKPTVVLDLESMAFQGQKSPFHSLVLLCVPSFLSSFHESFLSIYDVPDEEWHCHCFEQERPGHGAVLSSVQQHRRTSNQPSTGCPVSTGKGVVLICRRLGCSLRPGEEKPSEPALHITVSS